MQDRTPIVVVILVALAVSACGRLTGSGDDGRSGGIRHPTSPDEVILRVQTGGGLVAPGAELRRLPELSLFGDGRLVTEGPVIEIYPGPALPNVLVRSVSEAGIQAILRSARSAGLLAADAHHPFPCIADAGTTTFTVNAAGSTHVVSADALDAGRDGCPGVEADARAGLAAFQAKLFDLQRWLPEGALGPEGRFDPQAMRVYVQPAQVPPDPSLEQRPVDWPLTTPLSSFGRAVEGASAISCGVVRGEELRGLLPLARETNELTPWQSAGTGYSLLFRPMLPDETGC